MCLATDTQKRRGIQKRKNALRVPSLHGRILTHLWRVAFFYRKFRITALLGTTTEEFGKKSNIKGYFYGESPSKKTNTYIKVYITGYNGGDRQNKSSTLCKLK